MFPVLIQTHHCTRLKMYTKYLSKSDLIITRTAQDMQENSGHAGSLAVYQPPTINTVTANFAQIDNAFAHKFAKFIGVWFDASCHIKANQD